MVLVLIKILCRVINVELRFYWNIVNIIYVWNKVIVSISNLSIESFYFEVRLFSRYVVFFILVINCIEEEYFFNLV